MPKATLQSHMEGKTLVIGGRQFVDGVHEFPDHEGEPFMNGVARYYPVKVTDVTGPIPVAGSDEVGEEVRKALASGAPVEPGKPPVNSTDVNAGPPKRSRGKKTDE